MADESPLDLGDMPCAIIDFRDCGGNDEQTDAIRDKFKAERLSISRQVAHFLSYRLRIHVGDIAGQQVDAIVNSDHLISLVAGIGNRILSKGGPLLAEACATLYRTKYTEGLPVGAAEITAGGDLAAKFVIHTVGPIYGQNGGEDAKKLAECYKNCLKLAQENQLGKIALPGMFIGMEGYPPDEAAVVIFNTIRDILATDDVFDEIRLVFSEKKDADIFITSLRDCGLSK